MSSSTEALRSPAEVATSSHAAIRAPRTLHARLPAPKSYQYIFTFGMWAACLAWFHPRLASLLDLAEGPWSFTALGFFILFTEVAWLYASFNIGVIVFAVIYRSRHRGAAAATDVPITELPAVAVLYTTCNDFVESSVDTCVAQDYPRFRVYILDDSSLPEYRERIDRYARRHAGSVVVVRRSDRRGFKAGNLNHALSSVAVTEPIFALADADELLPVDFLRRLVPRLLGNSDCGFVQANHRCNPNQDSALAKSLGQGIDIHWRWYHPLRNRYGFVMLLGHGAVLRRQTWADIGGFPELVSEDLAFALRAREHGWRGHFAEDVICYEDFPETVRSFRVRHMKWTRGTCEFLSRELWRTIRSRVIPWHEKLDVLLPTLNLPLSLFYFLFIIDANVVLTSLYSTPHPVTLTLAHYEWVIPTLTFQSAFNVVNSADFFIITLATLMSPILCFVIDMWKTPMRLFRFLCQSTALYGALGPLSFLGVLCYAMTGKAVFHVTADGTTASARSRREPRQGRWSGLRRLLAGSHPDHWIIKGFEVTSGIVFGFVCLRLFQISFLGLALAFVLLPILHHVAWHRRLVRVLVLVPFGLLILGLTLGGMSLIGIQTAAFGFGFHF